MKPECGEVGEWLGGTRLGARPGLYGGHGEGSRLVPSIRPGPTIMPVPSIRPGPFSSGTGSAEPGTQHPAVHCLGMSDVEAGTGASLGDPGSHTKGSGLRDWLQMRFLPHRSKLFNPLHSSCPPGRHATQFENRCINKLTISVSASRSNLRQLSEIHCFPLQAAYWQ